VNETGKVAETKRVGAHVKWEKELKMNRVGTLWRAARKLSGQGGSWFRGGRTSHFLGKEVYKRRTSKAQSRKPPGTTANERDY